MTHSGEIIIRFFASAIEFVHFPLVWVYNTLKYRLSIKIIVLGGNYASTSG